jgi:hypothetical protein
VTLIPIGNVPINLFGFAPTTFAVNSFVLLFPSAEMTTIQVPIHVLALRVLDLHFIAFHFLRLQNRLSLILSFQWIPAVSIEVLSPRFLFAVLSKSKSRG